MIFEPLDFIARLAALIPSPQVIGQILDHLGLTAPAAGTALARGSPGISGELFDGP